MKKHIFFVGATMLSMMVFTPHAFSQDLNGCWKNEDTDPFRLQKICFSDTEIKTGNNMLLKIEDKKATGDNITITYSARNTKSSVKIKFIEKDKIHLTLSSRYKSVFRKETD